MTCGGAVSQEYLCLEEDNFCQWQIKLMQQEESELGSKKFFHSWYDLMSSGFV